MEASRKAESGGQHLGYREIDRYVGRRLRDRRIMLGLTQQEVADIIGVSFQQAHKYEKGISQIMAGRLSEIADVLDVTVDFFFEGFGQSQDLEVPPQSRRVTELVRNFCSIQNIEHKFEICQMVRLLAQGDGKD